MDKQQILKAVNSFRGANREFSQEMGPIVEGILDLIDEGGGGGSSDAVKYTQQELTEEQQSQARTNIGGASAASVIAERDRASAAELEIMDALDGRNAETVTVLPEASASTVGKIYYVGPDSDGEYARYRGIESDGSYSFLSLGSTEMDLTDYATEAELNQLDQKVESLDDMRVSEVIPASVGKNLYNPAAVTQDVRILANTGAEYDATGYNATEFIKIAGQTYITVSFTVSVTSGFVVAFYNANKVYISGASTTVNTQDSVTGRYYKVIDVPANAEYVRASSQIFELRKFMLENGSTPYAYEAYSYTPERTVEYFKDSVMPPSYDIIKSAAMGGALSKSMQALAANASIELEQNAVKQFTLLFYGKFSSFSGLTIGHGPGNHGMSLTIDGSNITFDNSGATLAHGLTIASYIAVSIEVKYNCDYTIRIDTLGGTYKRDYTYPSSWTGNQGKMFCTSVNTAFSVASLTFWAPYSLTKWLFGDSYVSNYSEKRWPYYFYNRDTPYTLINGIPGEGSEEGFVDFQSAITHGTPKFLIWALGMNDADSATAINNTWKTVIDDVISICEEKGITLILCTIPNVPSARHTFKNDWIKESGYRYIDFAEAVDAEAAGSTWLAGTLSTDDIHPTADGARLLYCRAIQDFPEFLIP